MLAWPVDVKWMWVGFLWIFLVNWMSKNVTFWCEMFKNIFLFATIFKWHRVCCEVRAGAIASRQTIHSQTIWTDSKAMKHTNGKVGVDFLFTRFYPMFFISCKSIYIFFKFVFQTICVNYKTKYMTLFFFCAFWMAKHYTLNAIRDTTHFCFIIKQ